MALAGLLSFVESLDPRGELLGLSYSLTNNVQLGYGDGVSSAFQFIPYGTWENYDQPQDQIPSVLEQAFAETIVQGHRINGQPDTQYSFIDILQLQQPYPLFFTEPLLEGPDQGKSLVEVLADTVNSIDPDVTPVIRYIVGNPTPPPTGPSPAEYVEAFWPQASNESIFTHPKAVLYVGSFNPDIELAQDLGQVVDRWIKALVSNVGGGALISKVITSVANAIIGSSVGGLIPPVTWNHAKIVAVNGRALLTGGGNYFDLYASGQDSLIDSDITILGDAAVSGHRYADYLWKYLNSNHLGYDNASQAWSTLLADPAPRHGIPLARQPAPMFPAATPRLKGDVPVLAMSKIGNFNPAGAIEYPAQVITAIRDVFYQLVWAKTPSWLPLVAELTSDARLDSAFEDVGVNPATWASRAARAQAVSQAQDYVILSQAMLVNWVMVPETAWQKLVAKINDDMNIGWDGKIWPFDLLISIAQAIINIEQNHKDDPDPTKAVFIMVSLLASPTDPAPQGYQDTTTIADLTSRVAAILKSVGNLSKDEASDMMARRFHVKRSVLNPPAGSGGSAAVKKLHTKVVDVDGKLMYTGSDNAYPQWNEQFGVWIEDVDGIKAWEDGFFWGFWERAVNSVM
ncbi:hypothetical protein MGG_09426 [Pyricularia oryzae 70-15]|uniref:PLD phosphodiesterase domain-containing protein n=2 Tax=Pyricularia oryzae TaxID=318829 RepID=G4NHV2_PYRO7|nr:uncharacterized protein MGG_09426 [Pyricularia oryzae 70-15]EHA47812.1 hypothetical protein MGG_09426 [Pyricularia oryzae 70-15]KAI7910047.1 hypothetical protein M9X92_011316 [Pyricularia oryzae]KAI7914407.1 hypothetical protein M0657_009492 [Pyricularia oryzae]